MFSKEMNPIYAFTFGFLTAAVLALIWLIAGRRGTTRTVSEVREYLEQFLSGEGSPYDWDDFLSISIKDPYLESIKRRAHGLQGRFPPTEPGHWCSAEGEEILRGLIAELKSHETGSNQLNKNEEGEQDAALKHGGFLHGMKVSGR
jgi:hypothetical protein